MFHKPVIFDDDGDGSGGPGSKDSDKNLTFVQLWVQQVTGTGCGTPAPQKGQFHFYHTKDGTDLDGTAPNFCRYDDSLKQTHVDCFSWNALADGIAEKFCGATGPHRVHQELPTARTLPATLPDVRPFTGCAPH